MNTRLRSVNTATARPVKLTRIITASILMLFLSFFFSDSAFAQNDLSLDADVTNTPAAVDWAAGEDVVFLLTVNNDGVQDNSGVAVEVPVPANMTFQGAANESAGTSFAGTTWTIGSALTAGQPSVTIELTYRIDAGTDGVFTLMPEISAMNEVDTDSQPANGVLTEDDIASACVSVPVDLICQDVLEATAPAGHTNYQWFKDDAAIFGATQQTYNITESGTYHYTLDDGTSQCPAELCCPIIARFAECAGLGDLVWYDIDNDGIKDPAETGISGVTVNLLDDTNTVIATTMTDNTGFYSFTDLIPGDYTVQFDHSTAPAGYEPTTQLNNSPDDPADSDADINTGLSHVVSLTAGEFDSTIDAGYFFPASLGDYVWLDTNADGIQDPAENGINGVTVNLFAADGTPLGTTTTMNNPDTGDAGFYEFTNLTPGNYYVEFDQTSAAITGPGYIATSQNQGGDTLDSDADPATGQTQVISLAAGENYPHLDAGFFLPAALGNYVWLDENINGIQEAAENGIEGVFVTLYNADNDQIVDSEITDSNGLYLFDNLPPGNYYVVFDQSTVPPNYIGTVANVETGADGDGTTVGAGIGGDSDADANTGFTGVYTLAPGDVNLSVDAGFYNPVALGDYVWFDEDHDGEQDPGESGIQNVQVTLYDGVTMMPLETTLTDPNGLYLFDSLPPGSYYVTFDHSTAPAGYLPTLENAPAVADDLDNDAATAGNIGQSQTVTLAGGETDFTLDAGYWLPASLGDFVWNDMNADGIQDAGEPGIEGTTVELFNGDGTSTGLTAVTDGTGFYEFTNLDPGDYYVVFDNSTATDGTATYTPSPTGNGNETNDSDPNPMGISSTVTLAPGDNYPHLDAGFFNPASLGDYVWFDENNDGVQDNNENGINGVSVDLFDGDGNFVATTTTFDNGTNDGFYEFTDLVPGDYYVVFDHASSTLTSNGYLPTQQNTTAENNDSDADPLTGQSQTVTLAAGDNFPDLDAGYYQAAGLGNYVWLDENNDGIQDPTEDGIAGVIVNLLDDAGNVIATDTTDNTGAYSFTGLMPGDYSVQFVPTSVPGGFNPTMQNNPAAGDAGDSDIVDLVNGTTATITLSAGEFDDTVDAGYFAPASLGDFAWYDIDADGIQDAGEPGIEGVTVTLFNGDGTPTGQTTATDGTGFYEFTNLIPGDYYVVFDNSTADDADEAMYALTTPGNGTDVTGSDANASGATPVVTLSAGENYPHLDAGYTNLASLGDYVWFDEDNDGDQDNTENGINGVTVSLFDGDNNLLATTLTANNGTNDGFYEFTGLEPGDYYVVFDHNSSALTSSGLLPTQQNAAGIDEEDDSDADPLTGQSQTVTLAAGDNFPDLDAGYYQAAGLGNYVWLDENNDGIQDPTEDGIAGVIVLLFDNLGNQLAADTTDNTGAYSFTGLTPGTYYVEFVPASVPEDMVQTMQNAGDDANDSDIVNPATGGTGFITLSAGEFDDTIDAGYFLGAGLGDYVWYDADGDGVQDAGETGINGVNVTLFNGDGTPTGEVTTTALNPDTGEPGYYEFTGLTPGEYYVVFDHNSAAAVDSNFAPTTEDANGTEATGSDANVLTGETEIVDLEPGDFYPHLDAGYYIPASLGDYVWFDENNNGVAEASETGINGVLVSLYSGDGTFLTQTVTMNDGTNDGFYEFTELIPGDYYVVFDHNSSSLTSEGYIPTTPNIGVEQADSDADPVTGQSETVTLAPGDNYEDLDAGYYQAAGLGNYVWLDENNDGIQDPTEDGIAGVIVNLLDNMGNILAADTTDNTGAYSFTGLTPGDYVVQFVTTSVPNGFEPTVQNNPAAGDAGDSDIVDLINGTTATISLASGEFDDTIDAGYFAPASLGDYVWFDSNGDGIQDMTESGIEGVTVELFNGDGTSTGMTVTTDGAGFYEFTGLVPGDYYVVFDNGTATDPTEAAYILTVQGNGNDTDGSDANAMGVTQVVTLAPGENYPHLDAGYIDCIAPDAGTDTEICEGESTTLTATGGNGSYVWSPGTGLSCVNCASPVAAPDQSTVYTVTTAVGTLCEATDTVVITVNALPEPDFHAEETCPDTETVFINHTPTGTTDNLIYEWNFDDPTSGTSNVSTLREPTHIYANAGEYDVMLAVETPAGCRDTIFETITVQPVPTAQAGDDVTICAGESIQLNAAGGDGTYTWTPDATLSNANIHNPIATPTVTTTYEVTVTNDFGCTSTDMVTVTVIEAPAVTDVAAVDPSDCGTQDGSITVTATGGATTLEYSIDGFNFQTSNEFLTLDAGTYNVFVRYVGGDCQAAWAGNAVILTAPDAPEFTSVNFTQPTDCGVTDGEIIISATAGSGTLEYGYELDGTFVWQTDNTFSGLAGGTYTTYVRNADMTCLTAGEIVVLTDPVAPTITKIDTFNPTDCGEQDGRIEIFANGTAGLEYSINGGGSYQTSNVFANLPASMNYEVIVRYADGTCEVVSASNPITLTAPTAPVFNDVVSIDPTECDTDDGSISIDATAGTIDGAAVAIEYSIDGGINWTTTPNFTNLADGTYNVFIRNAGENCVTAWMNNTVELQSPIAPIVKEVTMTDVTECGADDGTITVFAEDGQMPYEYGLTVPGSNDTLWQAGNVFSGLAADTYHIFVTNADGSCLTCYLSATVEEPTQPVIGNVLAVQPSDCGADDGRITIFADSEGALEYSIDNGATWHATNSFAFLPAGSYQIAVRNIDENCFTTYDANPVVLVEPTPPTLTDVIPTDPSDCDVNDGTIEITASGAGNLEYSIDGFNWSASNIFENLSNGTYNIFVRNEDETCATPFANNPVELTAPDAPQIKDVVFEDPTDCGVNDGFIQVTAIDGEGDLQYSIDGGATFQASNVFLGLAAGNYMVIVTNEDGSCMTMWPGVVLEAPELPLITDVITTNPTDCGESNGTIVIETESNSPLQFSIDGGTTWQTSNVFINLAGDDYDVRVRNTEGNCEVTHGIVTITEPTAPTVTTPIDNISICENDSAPVSISIDQAIIDFDIDGSGGFDNVTVSDNTLTFDAFLNGTVSNFSVTFTGESGCTVTEDFTLYETSDPMADFIVIQPTCANDEVHIQFVGEASPGAVLTWELDGGTILYSSPATSSQPAGALLIVEYAAVGGVIIGLEVNDGGCTDSSLQTANVSPTAPTLSADITPVSSCDTPNGEIDLTVTGNLPFESTYTYTWAADNGFASNEEDLTGLEAGTYYVTVVDQFTGCDHTAAFSVGNVPALDVFDYTVVNNLNCNGTDGIISYQAAGGTAPFTFTLVRLDADTETVIDEVTQDNRDVEFTDLASGLYAVRTDDAANCGSLETIVSIIDGSGPQGQFTNVTNPDCGLDNGSFTLILDSDAFPVNYSVILDGEFLASGSVPASTVETQFNQVGAGGYLFLLEDENGCTNLIRLENDCDPERCDFDAIAADVNQPTACSNDDGSISVTGLSPTASVLWVTSQGEVLSGETITGLGAGIYNALVSDGECSTELTYNLQAPDGGQISIDNLQNVTCPGGSDGSVVFTVSGDGYYTYSISPGDEGGSVELNPSEDPTAEISADNLDAGIYVISVRDHLTGCVNYAQFEIEQNDLLEIIVTPHVATACYASDARVEIQTNGGNSPYTLTASQGDIATNPYNEFTSVENMRGGVVNITVTDFNGCTDDVTVDLGRAPSCTDTVPLITIYETPLDTCLTDFFDLPGNVTTAIVCADDPNTVTAEVNDGSNCITLLPSEDFAGYDTLCVVHCDDQVANYCDTTILTVAVLPPTDTVRVTIPGDVPTEVCLDDENFQFPGTPTSVAFCNDEIAGEATADNLNGQCLTIDPVDGFAGTGSDLLCVVHCYDDAQMICDTTYIEITVTPTPDTVDVVIPANEETEICLDGSALEYPGTIETVAYCNQGDMNTVFSPSNDDNCLTLAPATDYTGYLDEPLCIVHCYGTVNGVEVCDTTYINVTVTPPADTVQVVISADEPSEVCLDETVLEFPDDLVSTTICNAGNPDEAIVTDIDDNCVTIDPADDFAGLVNDQLCVVHCYGDGTICDTTYLEIAVSPAPDTVEFVIPPNDDSFVCLDEETLEYPGTIESVNYCNQGDANTVFSPQFMDNCLALAPAMDFTGYSSEPICIIHCYGSFGDTEICDTTYINVTVTPPSDVVDVILTSDDPTEVCLDETVLEFPDDLVSTAICNAGNTNEVAVTNVSGNCVTLDAANDFVGEADEQLCVVHCYGDGTICDTTYLNVTVLPAPDTIEVFIPAADPTEICLDDDVLQFPGTFTDAEFCNAGNPNTVLASALTENCLTLNPNDSYVGAMPTPICVTHCYANDSAPSGEICDTTYIFVTVLPPSDIVEVTIPFETDTETCIPASVLQFPADAVSTTFCDTGNPNTVTASNLDGDCLTLEPADDYFGTSSDLICVVHCYDNASQICDTTYIEVTVEVPPCELVVTSVINFDAECGESNGSAIATTEGAVGTLVFEWEGSNSTTATATDLTAGMYPFTVTDQTTGCTATGMGWVGQVGGDVDFTTTNTQTATCEGADGTVNVNVTSGDAPFTVSYDGPTSGTLDNQTTSSIDVTGLAAGDYIFSVSDANGCATQKNVTVGSNSGDLTLDTQLIEAPACGGGDNGKVMAVVGNFSGSYSLTLDGTQIVGGITTPTFSVGNLTAGTYMLGVTDENGCTATTQFTLTEQLAPLTEDDVIITNATCSDETDATIASADERVFTVFNQAGDNLGTTPVSNLPAGMYTVTHSVGQCVSMYTALVIAPSPMSLTADVTDESCAGNDGALAVTVNGGTAPYTYAWNTGATTQNINGLTEGTYTLTVTDSEGCSTDDTFTVADGCDIPAPAPATFATSIPFQTPTSYCLPDEAMDYPEAATSQSFANVGDTDEVMGMFLEGNCMVLDPAQGFTGAANEPIVIVTCYYGGTEVCDTTYLMVTVEQEPCDLQLSGIAKTDAACGEDNGSAQVMTNGGTAPYTYVWTNNVSNAATAENLAQGNYSVTITDANDCTVSGSVTINNGQAISLNTTATAAVCEAANGTIDLNIIGGTPEYMITWSGPTSGSVTNITAQSYTLTDLPAGDYVLTVSDDAGCAATATRTVEQSAGTFSVTTATQQQPNCGEADGTVQINTGSNETFDLVVDGVLFGENLTAPFMLTDLNAGVHNIEVTNANGCVATDEFVLSEQDAVALNAQDVITSNVTCASGNDGSITSNLSEELTVFNGNTSLGQTPLTDLSAGTYTVVRYTGNCESSIQVTITQPEMLDLGVSATNETCTGDDGSITTTLTGGVTPYEYNWSNGTSAANATNLAAGTYSLTVIDAVGCAATVNGITIVEDCDPQDPIEPCADIMTEDNITVTMFDGEADVCVETEYGTLSDFDLTLDGENYTDALAGCAADTTIFYSYALVFGDAQNGTYNVEWTVNGTLHTGTFTNPTELTGFMNSVNATPQWTLDAAGEAIEGDNTPDDFGMMKIVHQATQITANLQVNYSTQMMSEGITITAAGDHILIATDINTGCTDTLYIDVEEPAVTPAEEDCDELWEDEVLVLETSDCNVPADFCSGVAIQEILEYDITDNGAVYTGDLSGCGYESINRYAYFSVPGQCSDGPYTLESWSINGTLYSGTFNDIDELVALLNTWDTDGTWAVDPYTFTIVGGNTDNDYGTLQIRHEASNILSGIAPNIGLQPAFANLELTVGTHELVFTHYLTDCADTITVTVTCPAQEVMPTTSTITRNILTDEEEPICLDISELPGTAVSIENVCPEDGGDAVVFETVGANCLIATGIEVGTGSACIVICDDQGVCDTTLIVINVQQGLVAVDTELTEMPTEPTDEPGNENPTLAEDRNEAYAPRDPNAVITVYTGFSPNGDGVNDVFKIKGLENYPNHVLTIFDRTGTTVMQTRNYQSDWAGDFNGEILPAGTYFYSLETGEDGERITGYVYLRLQR